MYTPVEYKIKFKMDIKMISKYRKTKDSTAVKDGISTMRACIDETVNRHKISSRISSLERIEKRNKRQRNVENECNPKRVRREPVGDFWSRVDSGDIDISEELDKMKAVPLFSNRIREEEIPNFNIITTSVADYSYKSTPFGDVYYSPRFQDDKYIYRYVILTKGVRNEAYRLLRNSKSFLLTEHQIIRELSIDLSPGWEHFMLFKNRLDELILRRKIM